MKELEQKILADGEILPNDVLKVGGFLNHQLDVQFLMQMGEELARLFAGKSITKVLTIEASGIALAVCVANYLKVPVVFAKKNKTSNTNGDMLSTEIFSYTHQVTYNVRVERKYLASSDRVLVVDDFLASGKALVGLMDLVKQAGATTVGCGIAIEKSFQGAGDELRAAGMQVESLAIIEHMENGEITFRAQ